MGAVKLGLSFDRQLCQKLLKSGNFFKVAIKNVRDVFFSRHGVLLFAKNSRTQYMGWTEQPRGY